MRCLDSSVIIDMLAGVHDVVAVRQQFDGARAVDLNEQIALEASRMQDQLMEDDELMAARDLLIAATA